jgi:hypothetical protein
MAEEKYTIKQVYLTLLFFGVASLIGAGFGFHYISGLLQQVADHQDIIRVSISTASGVLMLLVAPVCFIYAGYAYRQKKVLPKKINIILAVIVTVIISIGHDVFMWKQIREFASQSGYERCEKLDHCNNLTRNGGARCLTAFALPGKCG